MSKSIGNTLVPQKLTSTLGATWCAPVVAANRTTHEMSVSDKILKRGGFVSSVPQHAAISLGQSARFDPARHAIASMIW